MNFGRGHQENKRLTFESLEAREVFSATTSVDALISSSSVPGEAVIAEKSRASAAAEPLSDQSLTQEFQLEKRSDSDSRVVLRNRSDFNAHFSMRFNGNISINVHDLANQIRAMDEFGDIPDYQKAFHYVNKYHEHDFPLSQSFWIHEPSLFMNSIGAGLCDDATAALKLLWNAMGYESRIWLMTGHVVPEVFADGKWQTYDPDLKVVYYNRDGVVASVEELAKDRGLVRHPIIRTSEDNFVYSGRMASIYATQDNNKICTICTNDIVERDLYFQLPAGGTMEWGDVTSERETPATYLAQPQKLGQIKVTIPAGSTGSLYIPLALADVSGARGDSVIIAGKSMRVETDQAFNFFNEETKAGNRIQTIEYKNLRSPIEVHYFFNRQFAEIQAENRIEIQHISAEPAELSAEFAEPVAHAWNFNDNTDAQQRGLRFDGDQYYDLTNHEAQRIFQENSNFEITANVRFEDADKSRRPVFDSHRFSLEIDAQNRAHAYFRSDNGSWTSIASRSLAGNTWHQLEVSYRNGELALRVNDRLAAYAVGTPIDKTYPMPGVFIGKSKHVGGLFYRGEIENVVVRETPQLMQPVTFDGEQLAEELSNAPATVQPVSDTAPSVATFDGTNHIDLSESPAYDLFDGKSNFQITARVRTDAEDGGRRPIVDAHRFSLEIDSQNRAYVYYRTNGNSWASVRSQPLASDQWHDVSATYTNGHIALTINGRVAGARVSDGINANYQSHGLFIGKSQHMGGLNFRGQMEHVSIKELENTRTLPSVSVTSVPAVHMARAARPNLFNRS